MYLVLVSCLNHFWEIVDLSVSVGILDEDTTSIARWEVKIMVVVHYGLHSEVVGPRANDSKRMGMDVAVHIKHIVLIVFKLSGEKVLT